MMLSLNSIAALHTFTIYLHGSEMMMDSSIIHPVPITYLHFLYYFLIFLVIAIFHLFFFTKYITITAADAFRRDADFPPHI